MFGGVPASLLMDMARRDGAYTQLEFETPPELFVDDEYITDVFSGISLINEHGSRSGVTSTTEHPAFAAIRNWLAAKEFIHKEESWHNGDRALKPFYLNGVYFDVGEKFPSAAAMKHHLRYAHERNPRELFIQNVSIDAIKAGEHKNPTSNSMLIQIVDPDDYAPTTEFKFREQHTFKFLDASNQYGSDRRYKEEYLFSDDQANSILNLLQRAKANNMNVIVHCVAGLYRSGAVTQFAIEKLGFTDTLTIRRCNPMVLGKLEAAYEEQQLG